MEPILLYGHPAGSSMGLVAAFEWLGQPYRLCRVDMLGAMRLPGYARINARHETPALITERGTPISETIAIAGWMAARDPSRRISFAPQSPEADYMWQMLAFINTGFTGAFSPLWYAMEMTEPDPELQGMLRRWGTEAVIERHDKLEAMLGNTPFIAGDRPGLADGVLIGVARWLDFHGVAEPGRWPRLLALRRRIEAEPAVQFAVAIENGELPRGSGAMLGHVGLDDVISRYGLPAD